MMMQTLTTNIAHLPLPYQCAIEMLNNGDRTNARFSVLLDHFETAYGRQGDGMNEHFRLSAHAIAKRRYWNFPED